MGGIFDAYVMVDWSAANGPKTGSDSIWFAAYERTATGLRERRVMNCPTRMSAFEDLCDILSDFQARGLKTLVGFDFAFGYPFGFAQKLGLQAPFWKGIWQELAHLISDDAKNANNRFQVANDLNSRLNDEAEGPFWGCPQKQNYPHLKSKKPQTSDMVSQKRLCEQQISGVKPVWQLLGTGCVGSQTLMGIFWLEKLRTHPWFKGDLQVWPFETGLGPLQRVSLTSLTLCEIYPSQIKLNLGNSDVKDRAQVTAMATHYAKLDHEGELADLFCANPSLSAEEKERVLSEEGWVLGVGKSMRQKCDDWMAHYLRKPKAIYQKSEEMILEKVNLDGLDPDMHDVIIRMVHSLGEPDIIADIRFSKGAAQKGHRALKKAKPVFVDVEMVAHGIIRKRLPSGNDVRCHLNDPDVADLAQTLGTTRSAAALEKWGKDLEGAVVVIGNAPTALFHLLQGLKDKRFPKPALVIGCPVGFVGAAESKECLIEYADELGLPFITLRTQRGGSAIAAAALNGLAMKGIVQ